ncbi:MAG: phosphatase PAP2 family protein [Myxococcales bacterium]|nr:phosphatase PAP2 family protein [Myxococcales bacterium]
MRQPAVRRLPSGSVTIIRRVACLGFVASIVHGGAAIAQGYPDSDNSSEAVQVSDPRSISTTHRLEWHWKQVHWGELVATANLTVGAIVVSQVADPPARWTRVNAFDNWFRDRLKAEGATQRRIDRASDALALTLIGFPVLVDSVGVALIGDKNREVAGQLLAIQAQAFAMTGFLTTATKAATGRERPYAQEQGCAEFNLDCGRDANKSYFSGHTSFAFTGAGLTCVAHKHLRLFGRVGDPLACATALTLASATAIFRVSANAHWATGVLTGAGVGLFSGWLMPWLLHFRHDTSEPHDGPMRAHRFLSPYGSRHELGLSLAGAF